MKIHLIIVLNFLLLLGVTSMSSCKKDNQITTDKYLKVTIESTGDVQDYHAELYVDSCFDAKGKSVQVSGIAWDKQTITGTTVYEKQFDLTTNIFFKTDKKAAKLRFYYGLEYNYLHMDPNRKSAVTVTIKWYANDKLVKTEVLENYQAYYMQSKVFNASDYLHL